MQRKQYIKPKLSLRPFETIIICTSPPVQGEDYGNGDGNTEDDPKLAPGRRAVYGIEWDF